MVVPIYLGFFKTEVQKNNRTFLGISARKKDQDANKPYNIKRNSKIKRYSRGPNLKRHTLI
jgi:hypothetical protein